jgi:hypothetical protein
MMPGDSEGAQGRQATSTALHLIVTAGDRAYQAGDWSSALGFYRNAVDLDPGSATGHGLALAIGHCEIELAGADTLATMAPPPPSAADGERAQIIISRLRFRARELCQRGDHDRAARLLRFFSVCDPPIADAYAGAIDADGNAGRPPQRGSSSPAFLVGIDPADVAAMRRVARGRRLMLVFRRTFAGNPARQYQLVDMYLRTAARFGFSTRHVDSLFAGRTPDPVAAVARLAAEIEAFRPDVILYEGLFDPGIAAGYAAVEARVADVLAAARGRGARVVNCFADVWRVPHDQLFQGLGSCVDLVTHCHPTILGRGTREQNEAVFCFMPPIELPAPTVAAGTIARAGFVGSIADFNISRLVWWAEAARRGLPLDFLETDHMAATQRPDQAFADLLRAYRLTVNFTRRSSGVPIITGRTVQTLLAGGVLLEEATRDSAYFLQPGVHYLEFTTLDDLARLIDRMLADPAGCARLAEAGRRWATTYFTGDHFWTGLLRQLAGGPGFEPA